jgi:hypothetical protein
MNDLDALRLDLADLANEVRPVDLRDRSLAASRRIRTRRAMVSSAVVVALVVAGVALLARPGRERALPPVGPTITLAPSPDRSPDPTATPPAGLGPWSSSPAPSLPGTTYFVLVGEAGAIVVETAGGTVRYRVPYDIGGCSGGFTVHGVSGDGHYVGVNYAPSDPGGVAGTMRVVDMTSGREIALPGPSPSQALSHVLFLGDGGLLVQARSEDGSGTLHLACLGRHDVQTLAQGGAIRTALVCLHLPEAPR